MVLLVNSEHTEQPVDPPIDRPTLLRLAAEADSDPRSVLHELLAQQGKRKHVRGRPGERIRAVLARNGLHQGFDEPQFPPVAQFGATELLYAGGEYPVGSNR